MHIYNKKREKGIWLDDVRAEYVERKNGRPRVPFLFVCTAAISCIGMAVDSRERRKKERRKKKEREKGLYSRQTRQTTIRPAQVCISSRYDDDARLHPLKGNPASESCALSTYLTQGRYCLNPFSIFFSFRFKLINNSINRILVYSHLVLLSLPVELSVFGCLARSSRNTRAELVDTTDNPRCSSCCLPFPLETCPKRSRPHLTTQPLLLLFATITNHFGNQMSSKAAPSNWIQMDFPPQSYANQRPYMCCI